MLKNTSSKKLLCALIIGCLMIAMLGVVWATTPATAGTNQANTYSQKPMHPVQQFETLLPQLVKEGKLTQAKADSILAFLDKMQPGKPGQKPADGKAANANTNAKKDFAPMKKMGGGIVELLQQQGIITADEAAAINAKMKAVRAAEQKARLNELLGILIENKVITEEQSQKIAAFIEQKNAERKAEADKIQKMTDAERKAYFEQQKSVAKVDMVTEMVNQGIITQSQAKLLSRVMPMGHGPMDGGPMGHGKGGRGREGMGMKR